MIHVLKITPNHFKDVISGKKPFEVRKNDRDYREHEYIALNEYNHDKDAPERDKYSGRSALFRISYILDNPQYCKEGYVILGLAPCIVEKETPGEAVTVLNKPYKFWETFFNEMCMATRGAVGNGRK